jgi:hypothetical protein
MKILFFNWKTDLFGWDFRIYGVYPLIGEETTVEARGKQNIYACVWMEVW